MASDVCRGGRAGVLAERAKGFWTLAEKTNRKGPQPSKEKRVDSPGTCGRRRPKARGPLAKKPEDSVDQQPLLFGITEAGLGATGSTVLSASYQAGMAAGFADKLNQEGGKK